MQPITVGLIGCGNAGRTIHMRLLQAHEALYRVACCADALPASAESMAGDFSLRAASVDAVVDDPAVELVVVATRPPVTHRDIAVRALAAGKHVVVEKPMAGSDAECAEMVTAAAAAGRVLSVHHNRRWDVDFLATKYAIECGAMGQPRLVRNEYAAGFAGSPYDWGIHIIDQTMALAFGRRFVELSAAFCTPNPASPSESEGFFTCRLRTEDGVIHDMAMLPPVNGNAYLPGRMVPRFYVAGTEGVFFQEWCQRAEDAFMKTAAMQPVEGGKRVGDLPWVESQLAIPDFYHMLYEAIRHDGPNPGSGAEGRRAVRAWELICQSACEGRTLNVSL